MSKKCVFVMWLGVFLAFVFIYVFLLTGIGSLHWTIAGTLIFASTVIYAIKSCQRVIKDMSQKLEAKTLNIEKLEKQERIHKKVLDVARYIALNTEFDKALEELLPKLADLTHSNCCAFYAVNNVSKLSLKHSIGFGKNIYSEFDLAIGEGFIGNLALRKDITLIHDVPEDTIYMVRTFLGKIKPRNVIVAPVFHKEQLSGVLVCANIRAYTEDDIAFVDMVKYYLGVAVDNGINREKSKRLANEMAFQNNLIQNQHEVMRKRLEDKELLIRQLVNMADNEIICLLDAGCKVIYWSDVANAIYGLTKEETVGRYVDQIYGEPYWPPIEEILKNITAKRNLECCTWYVDKDGKKHRFEMQFCCLAEEDLLGIVVKARPIL